jgi:Na+/melibiose symporter-like transporter
VLPLEKSKIRRNYDDKEKRRMKKEKDANRLGFKAYFGTTLMGTTEGVTAALTSSFFMLYLTDYSGMGARAASFGSALLLFARVFDAVNDPFEGWIMDRAKVGKYGKYKPFIILSILMQTIGAITLFFLPGYSNAFSIGAWMIIGYLLYDIGYSFLVPNAVYKTLTHNDVQRGKLMIGPRLMGMAVGMMMSSLISIVSAVNQGIGDLHKSFGIVVTIFVSIAAVISLIGISLVKEKYHATEEQGEGIKLTDFFKIIRYNKAVLVKVGSALFSGFIYTLLFAAANYYIKWAYCADLETGAVDTARYGAFVMVSSMIMFMPLIIGTVIATPLLKKIGSAIRFMQSVTLIQALSCGMIFVFQFVGILRLSPIALFACMSVAMLGMGAGFIPGEVVNIEIMDYEVYKNGKDRSAMLSAFSRFVMKCQSAVATAVVGFLLVSIGYVVDSKTDTFIGDLSQIPDMLNGFALIMGLIPCICGVIGWFILRKYPINDAVRAEMKIALNR